MPQVHTTLDAGSYERYEEFKERYGATNSELIPYMVNYALDLHEEYFASKLINQEKVGTEKSIQLSVDKETKEMVSDKPVPQKELIGHSIRFSLYYWNDFANYFASETVDDEFREEHYGVIDEPEVEDIVGEKKFRDMTPAERRKHAKDQIDALGTEQE